MTPQERALAACERLYERLEARGAEVGRLTRERDRARAMLEASNREVLTMRPVVEAALAWRDGHGYGQSTALAKVVDDYRARTAQEGGGRG